MSPPGGHQTITRGPQVQDLLTVFNHFRPADEILQISGLATGS